MKIKNSIRIFSGTGHRRGQALTEYALLLAVTVFSLVAVNKLFIGVISRALARIVEIVSLPFP